MKNSQKTAPLGATNSGKGNDQLKYITTEDL